MVLLFVIDYVVVYEFVYFEEKNYGKNFWIKIKLFMFDYKKYEDWLKKNGYLLNL